MRLVLLLTLGFIAYASAQQDPVPVNQEPHHKVILKNDYIEVMRVNLAAGESTLQHTHSHPGIAVRLSKTKIRMENPGQDPAVLENEPGSISVQPYKGRPFTHRVTNLSDSPFDVIDVEFLKRPDGPQTEPLAKVMAENESARVYKWDLAPKASSPQHTHERPYLIMTVTPMELGMRSPDGRSMSHHIEPGNMHWVDSPVVHTLTNEGPQNATIVEIELK